MSDSVGALERPVTSNTNTYVPPGTEIPAPEAAEHHRLAEPLMLQPVGLFGPCPRVLQVSPVSPVTVDETATFVAPVNCTENDERFPEIAAPEVSMVRSTRNPPEPSEPPEVNV